MKTYQVGGAVRDTLLSQPYVETDWVFLASISKTMKSADYKQISRNF